MARELLAEMDRVRLVAALGVVVFRARKVDAEWLRLLHKLSGADTQVWVQQSDDLVRLPGSISEGPAA